MKRVGVFNLVWVISLAVLVATAAKASELAYHNAVDYKDIAKGVLNKTIGVLFLSAKNPSAEPKKLTALSETNRQMKLDLKRETLPITYFGYSFGQEGFPAPTCYSYPVLAIRNKYLLIVYDAKTGKKAWIAQNQLGKDGFSYHTVKLNYLDGESVSLYFKQWETSKKIYSEPDLNASFKSLDMPSEDAGFYYIQNAKVDGQVSGFVKVVGAYSNSKKISGWIPIRDESGSLNIWPTVCSDEFSEGDAEE